MANELRCTIVTPEKAILDQTVEMVVLPMVDGELGVQPGRQAMVGRLGPGELRLISAGANSSYFIEGGFAQVQADVVTVLTSKATAADKLDLAKAESELVAATALPATTAAEGEKRLKAVHRASAMVRLVSKTSKS